MSPNPIDIIITIPEIQIALRAELPQEQLYRTLLVSKQWYSALLPACWHTIDIGAFEPNPPPELLLRVGHLIRNLVLRQYTALAQYAPVCRRLQNLTVETFDVPPPVLSDHWPSLLQLLQGNPDLTTLHLNIRNKPVGRNILDAFAAAPRLTRLAYSTSLPVSTVFILELLEQCPMVEDVTIHSRHSIQILSTENYFATRGEGLVFRHLRRLDVPDAYKAGMLQNFWLPIWQRAPRIQVCVAGLVAHDTRQSFHELQTLFQHACRHVQELHLIGNEVATLPEHSSHDTEWLDSSVAALISDAASSSSSPSLSLSSGYSFRSFSHLRFVYCPVSLLTVAAITTHHSQSLVSLTIVADFTISSCRLSSAAIASIVRSCPNLKTLRLSERRLTAAERNQHFALNARDAVQEPWVCLGLEFLELQVVGICRPKPPSQDSSIEYTWAPARALDHLETGQHKEQCFELQRQVFRQLGKLTKLKHLLLGHSAMLILGGGNHRADFIRNGQFDCLDFRLGNGSGNDEPSAGGLEYLVGLNRLEELSVASLVHNIGLEEVVWMLSYWPNLRRLVGLGHPFNDNTSVIKYLWAEHPSLSLH